MDKLTAEEQIIIDKLKHKFDKISESYIPEQLHHMFNRMFDVILEEIEHGDEENPIDVVDIIFGDNDGTFSIGEK